MECGVVIKTLQSGEESGPADQSGESVTVVTEGFLPVKLKQNNLFQLYTLSYRLLQLDYLLICLVPACTCLSGVI